MPKNPLERRTIRSYLADWDPVLLCEGPVGCRMGWSKRQHLLGRVDSFGYIHLAPEQLDLMVNRQRLYHLLVLVVESKSREFRREPEHLRLWHTNTEATRIMFRKYKARARWWYSKKARERSLKLAQESGAHYDPYAYWVWLHPEAVMNYDTRSRAAAGLPPRRRTLSWTARHIQRGSDSQPGTPVG